MFSLRFGKTNEYSLELAILNVVWTQIYLKICVRCC